MQDRALQAISHVCDTDDRRACRSAEGGGRCFIKYYGIKNNTYICMPVILRLLGFTFFFFSRDHEPIHVHIEGTDGDAVYDLRQDRFVQRMVNNIKAGDLRKIERVLDENKEMFIRSWNSYFNNTMR